MKKKNELQLLTRRDLFPIPLAILGFYASIKFVAPLEPFLKQTQTESNLEQKLKEENERLMRLLLKKYKIKILDSVVNMNILQRIFSESDITADQTSLERFSRALYFITNAIFTYPPNFFDKNNIKEIVIVENLKVKGNFVSAWNPKRKTIFLSTTTPKLNDIQEFEFARLLHHDFFHSIDFDSFEDEWINTHPCSCKVYLDIKGYEFPSDVSNGSTTLEITNPQIDSRWFAGFASLQQILDAETGMYTTKQSSSYGRSNSREDRAQTAEIVMDRRLQTAFSSYHTTLKNGNEEDKIAAKVLGNKIAIIKQIYLEKSGGLMNELYWRDLYNGSVTENYFK